MENMIPIVLLCDGTWCGRETGTQTNVYRLAELVGLGVTNPNSEDEYVLLRPEIKVRYRHGVGLNSGFLDYLFNGVTAMDIAQECTACYKFIVDHYDAADHEVWMFGLSRGAYTVRCVAGMINNCGIVRRQASEEQTRLLCEEVYRIYRSKLTVNEPHSAQSADFRRRKSWPLIGDEAPGEAARRPPVTFMGLWDTVGSLGIPTLTGGVGLDWPKFYDDKVSSVVDRVHHFVSLHDRFYIFQPCLARRSHRTHGGRQPRPVHEEWLPGVHYDLGRQRFRFFRMGASFIEGLLARWEFATKVIEPNEVLADFAFLKMLNSIQAAQSADPTAMVIPSARLDTEMQLRRESIASGNASRGDGDVYARITQYGPWGQFFWDLGRLRRAEDRKTPAIWSLFFALRPRFIPADNADVYDYTVMDEDVEIPGVVGIFGDISVERYPSKTRQSWMSRM
ncbi:hypothetical protein MAPG_05981 [Magnaporthiopsis poae ATCC 64411]|uniref:T6SS Phospholipase effector Tle1-like catalytic domain-containing protein n=1 Tax=Magnaporthiopsis poae (strain ATCC 64411 / 73-15) TaxID=644358 RepID=A0A0C4E0U4_MAGP6|nr:hypothetical protein MAPG_05981 [Magnaporthiopsis poae ATCC 64411]